MSIVLALLAVAAPIGDVSTTVDERRQTTVATRDLDLASASDLRHLRTRVHTAVEAVCAIGGRTMEERRWRESCRSEAMNSARPGVDAAIAGTGRNRAVQLSAR